MEMKMCMSCSACLVNYEQDTTSTGVRRLEWLALSALKLIPNPPTYLDVYFNSMPDCLVPFELTLEVIDENSGSINVGGKRSGDSNYDMKEKTDFVTDSRKEQSKLCFTSLFQRKQKRSVEPFIEQPQKSTAEALYKLYQEVVLQITQLLSK